MIILLLQSLGVPTDTSMGLPRATKGDGLQLGQPSLGRSRRWDCDSSWVSKRNGIANKLQMKTTWRFLPGLSTAGGADAAFCNASAPSDACVEQGAPRDGPLLKITLVARNNHQSLKRCLHESKTLKYWLKLDFISNTLILLLYWLLTKTHPLMRYILARKRVIIPLFMPGCSACIHSQWLQYRNSSEK